MTTPELVALIKEILPQVSDPDDVIGFEPGCADFELPRRQSVKVEPLELRRLSDLLRSFKEIARLEGGIFHYSPGASGSPTNLDAFSSWLLAQSRFRPPEECVKELFEVIRVNSSPVLEIIPIWGISPRNRIPLAAGLSVFPIADLPESKLKDLLTGKRRHKFSFDIANSSPRPGAAIVFERDIGPIFEPPDSDAARLSAEEGNLVLAMISATTEAVKQEAMLLLAKRMGLKFARPDSTSIAVLSQDLSAVIALLVPKPVFTLGGWYQRPSNIPIVGKLGGWSGPTNEHPFFISIDAQDYPYDEISALVARYLQLDEKMRKRLRVPLIRLNQSRRYLDHLTVEAAAIDLGIALEALLTSDKDHDAPISYALRIRGTLFLGGSAEQRNRNIKLLRDVYELRSAVAHHGEIVDLREVATSKKMQDKLAEARDQIKAGQEICKALLLKLIEDGRFPDWDLLMLGVPSPSTRAE